MYFILQEIEYSITIITVNLIVKIPYFLSRKKEGSKNKEKQYIIEIKQYRIKLVKQKFKGSKHFGYKKVLGNRKEDKLKAFLYKKYIYLKIQITF